MIHVAAGWVAALCRLAPAVALLPPLNWWGLPWSVRLALAAGISLLAAPLAAAAIGQLSPELLLHELAVGVGLALVISLPFWALHVAGSIADVAWGAPADSPGPAASAIYLLGAAVVVALGGHTWIVAALAGTYTALPPATAPQLSSAMLARAAAEMLGAGVLIAIPLIALCGIVHLVAVLVERAVPVPTGLPIRPVAVVLGLAAAAPMVATTISREISAVVAFLAGGGG